MKQKKTILQIYIALCLLLLIAAVCNFILLRGNLYQRTYLPEEFSETESGLTLSDLSLKKGTYQVVLTSQGASKDAVMRAQCSSGRFYSGPAAISASSLFTGMSMDLGSDCTDISIVLDAAGSDTWEIQELSVLQTTSSAKRTFFYSILACAVIGLFLLYYFSDLSKRKIFFILSAITIFSSLPLFLNYLAVGHDLPFHLLRIDGIYKGLSQGYFPVKIQPIWAQGHGYATGVFYGDVLLYFPAFLRFMGLPVQTAYQFFVFAVNLATVLTSYYCFRRIFSNVSIGLLGGGLYVLSPYRLANVYTRGAVGEYCAMIFLPLLLVGLYIIFTEAEQSKTIWKTALLPAFALTGIIQSHILTCEMVAVFIILACLILWKRTFKPHTFAALSLTVILTLLMNIGFLVPLVDYYSRDILVASDKWTGGFPIQSYGLFPAQVFSVFFPGSGGNWQITNGIMGEFVPGIGLALIACLLLYMYTETTCKKSAKKENVSVLSTMAFFMAVLLLFMSTCLFPWDWISSHIPFLKKLIYALQFPWRFFSLGSLLLAVPGCFVLCRKELFEKASHLRTSVMVLLSLLTVLTAGWFYYSFLYTANPYRVYDTYELPSMQMYSHEYLPEDMEPALLREGIVYFEEGTTVSEYNKNNLEITFSYTQNESDGYVDLPLTCYNGYTARSSQGSLLTVGKGQNGLLRVHLPANTQGSIFVCFKEAWYWRLCEIISALSVLLFGGLLLSPYYKRKSKV